MLYRVSVSMARLNLLQQLPTSPDGPCLNAFGHFFRSFLGRLVIAGRFDPYFRLRLLGLQQVHLLFEFADFLAAGVGFFAEFFGAEFLGFEFGLDLSNSLGDFSV